MAYYRNSRSPLTPPADLIGQRVSWRPKGADGKRHPAVYGRVASYDAAARTLTITVQLTVSAWQTKPERDVTVPLSSGPFTPTS